MSGCVLPSFSLTLPYPLLHHRAHLCHSWLVHVMYVISGDEIQSTGTMEEKRYRKDATGRLNISCSTNREHVDSFRGLKEGGDVDVDKVSSAVVFAFAGLQVGGHFDALAKKRPRKKRRSNSSGTDKTDDYVRVDDLDWMNQGYRLTPPSPVLLSSRRRLL